MDLPHLTTRGFAHAETIAAVMNLLGQTIKSQSLDKAGVAQLLQQEHQQFMSSGSDASKLVMKALDAGKEAAVVKARYSADQWAKVRLAPIAVAR